MVGQVDEHYSNPRLAELYDADCPWGEDKEFYLKLPPTCPISILDIGCGTGQLSEAYAALGHDVMGIDPAAAMLNVARVKPNARHIEWQLAKAQTFRTERKFDLIVMTGNALQTLLMNDDIAQTFKHVASHLKANGQFVFETRNPSINWMQKWGASAHPDRRFICVLDTKERKIFERHYILPKGDLVSRSELRFWTTSEILHWTKANGLIVQHLFGDWNREPYDPQTSEEMVFVCTC